MTEETIGKCSHPGCNCPAAVGSKYCGTYCEGSAEHPSIACNCGHQECAVGEAVEAGASFGGNVLKASRA